MSKSSWDGSCMWWLGICVFMSLFLFVLSVGGISCGNCCVFCFFVVFRTSSCLGSSVPPALYDLL